MKTIESGEVVVIAGRQYKVEKVGPYEGKLCRLVNDCSQEEFDEYLELKKAGNLP